MVSYRTNMHIIGDLLTATEYSGLEGIKTTALIRKANLSHSKLSKFVSNLTGSGLINKIEFDGKHTFIITPKGRQFLESYEKFANFVKSFGLDL
jgi:predicted transcriptional regulator